MDKRGFMTRALAAGMLALLGTTAQAVDFPTEGKPVTIYLGFPAGGGMDAVARILQQSMPESLGTDIIVDYRPGAGGNISSDLIANSKPDGYTLMIGTAGTHGMNATLYKKLAFDVEEDFTPIAKFLVSPNVLVINPEVVDVDSVQGLIDEVKAHPGEHFFASSGQGTSTHLGFEMFASQAGLDMEHVPFKGSADAMLSLMRGEVCCILTQTQAVLPLLNPETAVPIGVSTTERLPILPDVPTIDEAGVPGYEGSLWFGLFGPAGMEESTVAKISAAVKHAIESPKGREKLESLGNKVQYEDPEQFRATVKADRAKWAEIITNLGLSID